MEKFGNYLSYLLEIKQVTKAELARKLDLKRQNYIGNVISGKHTPTLKRVNQIANILKCTSKEKNHILKLAISERTPDEIKGYLKFMPARYPKSREILLDFYNYGHKRYRSKALSKEKMKEELEKKEFHHIEIFLLKEIYNRLIQKNIITSKQGEYFVYFFESYTLSQIEDFFREIILMWQYFDSGKRIYPEIWIEFVGKKNLKEYILNWVEIE